MNASLKTILVTTATYLSLSGMAFAADDASTAATSGSTTLTHEEARDLKTQSKAEYKARKKIAEANKDLEVADCKTGNLEMKDERDCKHEARQAAKDAKRDAKQIYKEEKADIKAHKE